MASPMETDEPVEVLKSRIEELERQVVMLRKRLPGKFFRTVV